MSFSLEKRVRKFLLKLPSDRGLRFQNDHAWINCPFHNNGMESTPSCMINVSKKPYGFFYCYACQAQGNLDKITSLYGLGKFSSVNMADDPSFHITEKLKESFLPDDEEENIKNPMEVLEWNPNENWRGISGKLLSKLNAKLYLNSFGFTQLLLPVRYLDEIVGNIECQLEKKEGVLSYINSPGSWVKKSWFLYDYFTENFSCPYVVIVEGPRDALNLVQNNIPAIALLGSHNWSNKKSESLCELDINTVFLGLDPDNAGRSAAKKIRADLKKEDLRVFNLRFPDGKDPADVKEKSGLKLKDKLEKLVY